MDPEEWGPVGRRWRGRRGSAGKRAELVVGEATVSRPRPLEVGSRQLKGLHWQPSKRGL